MRTRTKTPSISRGILGGKEIVVKPSKIAKGVGVFTKRAFTKGDLITWYSGYYKKVKTYEYVIDNDGKNLVGHSKNIQGRGVAQLANSAVCPLITGVKNNCVFVGDNTGLIWLCAKHFIPTGSELFVHYSSGYWTNKEHLVGTTEEEISCLQVHSQVAKIVEDTLSVNLGGCRHPTFTDDILTFKYDLLEDERSCPFTHLKHVDNFFKIQLIRKENFQVHYQCDTCQKSKFLAQFDRKKQV